MSAEGGQRRLVARRCYTEEFNSAIAWSPDGRKIACSAFNGDLLAVSLCGGRVRTLRRGVFADGIDWQPR